MAIYSRYIFLYLIKIFTLIIVTLTTIVILIQLLAFINQYIKVNLGFFSIIKFILFQSSSICYYISPVALICTILYVYYSLSIDKEIIILESSGVSKYELASPAIKFSIVVMILSYAIIMLIDPLATQAFRNHKKKLIQSSMVPSILEEKSFNRITQKIVLYIDKQEKDNKFSGVAIYDQRAKDHYVTIFAEKAEIINKNDQFIFVLHNGSRQEVSDNSLRTLYFGVLSLPIETEKITDTKKHPSDNSEYTIVGLLLKKVNNAKQVSALIIELNNRISYPILNFIVAIISLAALFSISYSRQWQISKIKNAIIFSIVAIAIFLFLRINVTNHFFFIPILYSFIFFTIYLGFNTLKSRSEGKEALIDKVKNQVAAFSSPPRERT